MSSLTPCLGVCVCFKFPSCHLFLLSRQSDHSEFTVRSQNWSPWSSTGAGAVDIAQQVKGRLGKEEDTVSPVSGAGGRRGVSLDILEMSPNPVIDPVNSDWGEHHCCHKQCFWAWIKDPAVTDVTRGSNSDTPDFSGKTCGKITSKYI